MHLRPIIAHRGFSDVYPENTMLAFSKALELGVSCIETDVTILKDNTLVLFHDYKTNIHSDFSGIIHDLDENQLSTVDAGSWKDPKFAGNRIPALQEILSLVKSSHTILNLELKGESGKNEYYWDKIVDLTIAMVHELGVQDNVFYSSFEFPMLQRLKNRDPNARFGVLFSKNYSLWKQVTDELEPQAVHLSVNSLDSILIQEIKAANYEIYVYTVNDPLKANELFELGVDGIFTDVPQKFPPFLY